MVASSKEQVMNTQQAYEPEDKVEVTTGRPMWQVSLMASIQRGQKRLKRGRVCVSKAVRAVLTTSAATGRADVTV